MMRLFKFLKAYRLKNSQRSHKTGGFTLIELLVGIIMTSLIITPLLGLVINMMDTDRKEQAKATSEQEIQAALDYIARDLDQAFFIYDGLGLREIKNDLPQVAVADADEEGEPVLVFWKRKFLPNSLPITGKGIGDCANNDNNCDDGFVYSLVSYYLIKDDNCNNSAWSCAMRISRIELKDALYDVNNPVNGEAPPVTNNEASPGIGSVDQLLEQSGSLEEKLNNWAGGGYDYTATPFQTLIDYIDQSTGADVPQPQCSTETRPEGSPRLDGSVHPAPYPYRQVPDPGSADNEFLTGSFYACVNTDQTVAQVFIRGNALARLRPKNQVPLYAANQRAYFPQASIQAQGSGLLNVNPSQ